MAKVLTFEELYTRYPSQEAGQALFALESEGLDPQAAEDKLLRRVYRKSRKTGDKSRYASMLGLDDAGLDTKLTEWQKKQAGTTGWDPGAEDRDPVKQAKSAAISSAQYLTPTGLLQANSLTQPIEKAVVDTVEEGSGTAGPGEFNLGQLARGLSFTQPTIAEEKAWNYLGMPQEDGISPERMAQFDAQGSSDKLAQGLLGLGAMFFGPGAPEVSRAAEMAGPFMGKYGQISQVTKPMPPAGQAAEAVEDVLPAEMSVLPTKKGYGELQNYESPEPIGPVPRRVIQRPSAPAAQLRRDFNPGEGFGPALPEVPPELGGPRVARGAISDPVGRQIPPTDKAINSKIQGDLFAPRPAATQPARKPLKRFTKAPEPIVPRGFQPEPVPFNEQMGPAAINYNPRLNLREIPQPSRTMELADRTPDPYARVPESTPTTPGIKPHVPQGELGAALQRELGEDIEPTLGAEPYRGTPGTGIDWFREQAWDMQRTDNALRLRNQQVLEGAPGVTPHPLREPIVDERALAIRAPEKMLAQPTKTPGVPKGQELGKFDAGKAKHFENAKAAGRMSGLTPEQQSVAFSTQRGTKKPSMYKGKQLTGNIPQRAGKGTVLQGNLPQSGPNRVTVNHPSGGLMDGEVIGKTPNGRTLVRLDIGQQFAATPDQIVSSPKSARVEGPADLVKRESDALDDYLKKSGKFESLSGGLNLKAAHDALNTGITKAKKFLGADAESQNVSKALDKFIGRKAFIFSSAQDVVNGAKKSGLSTKAAVDFAEQRIDKELREARKEFEATALKNGLSKEESNTLSRELVEFSGGGSRLLKAFTRYVKTSKVLLNPMSSYVNNGVGNIGFQLMGGGSKKMGASATELRSGGAHYQRALKDGLFGSEFFAHNKMDFIKNLRADNAEGVIAHGMKYARKPISGLASLYDGTDKVFKLAAYMQKFEDLRKIGLSESTASREAVHHVGLFFPNYEKIGGFTGILRKSSFAPYVFNPFIAFPAESARIYKNWILHGGARGKTLAAALPAYLWASHQRGLLLNQDPEEVSAAREDLPGYQNFGGRFNVPLRKTADGEMQFLDITQWVPLLDLLSGGTLDKTKSKGENIFNLATNALTRFIGGGLLTSEQYKASGQPGVYQSVENFVKAPNRGTAQDLTRTRIGGLLTPPIVSRGLAFGQPRKGEEEGDMFRDALAAFGIRTLTTSDATREQRDRQEDGQISEVSREAGYIENNQNIPVDDQEELIEDVLGRYENLE